MTWICGLNHHRITRKDIDIIEWDEVNGLVKINLWRVGLKNSSGHIHELSPIQRPSDKDIHLDVNPVQEQLTKVKIILEPDAGGGKIPIPEMWLHKVVSRKSQCYSPVRNSQTDQFD